tara:strand:+ start:420 stop:857 length:438 start_codon:yes stop_codon:yes gene_type:complete
MSIKDTMRELYEQVRKYDDLLDIPHSVKYSENHALRSGIKNLLREVEHFNKFPNEKESLTDCKRLFNNAMRLIAELIEQQTKLNYTHQLNLKKKDYVIDNLKKYIESKEDLDAEIPSDDDEEEKSDEKELKGLSRKERDLIKSIK